MRIIHTSDWHLGQYFYGKSRANEHQQFLSWLLSQVSQHDIDAIIVAGDIFDTSTPPSYAREMYFDFIAKLHKTSCQLIILAGNHDSVAMLSESQAVLASLSTRVITHVIPVSCDITEQDQGQDQDQLAINQQVFALKSNTGKVNAIVCAIPFVRPRDVVKSRAGQSASEKQQNLQQAISEHYQQLHQHAVALVELVKQEQGDIVPIIATGHLTALGVSVSDSKSDSVRDIYIGSLEAFPASAFPPADYIALGHIHRAQQVAKSKHIRYCGSPIALSFDEAKQDKRVLMVEFSQGELKQVEDIIVPCFQPLYMLKTSIDGLEISLQETLLAFEEYKEKQAATLLAGDIAIMKAWIDIEIDNGDHLSDLSQRVSELAADMPFEVLLVRRCKKARKRHQAQLSEQDNSTLSELSLSEVFDSRLSQLDWQSDEEVARKARLQQLFAQLSSELVVNDKQANVTQEIKNASDKSQGPTEKNKTEALEQDNL
ncbi:MAG: exonuclease subunit SbcD [Colwellia sp.]|nr:exonuclease subunit SbcD [Colwellia sp.]